MITTRIRLIALDLDGTLVGTNLTISPRVRESIVQARARGAEVTIVTGRMFAAAKPFSANTASAASRISLGRAVLRLRHLGASSAIVIQ